MEPELYCSLLVELMSFSLPLSLISAVNTGSIEIQLYKVFSLFRNHERRFRNFLLRLINFPDLLFVLLLCDGQIFFGVVLRRKIKL